jgi:hypothetical protein
VNFQENHGLLFKKQALAFKRLEAIALKLPIDDKKQEITFSKSVFTVKR